MTWLTWRQARTQIWVALGALAVLAVALAVTGPHLVHLYDTSGIRTCHTNCESLVDGFHNDVGGGLDDKLYLLGLGLMFLLPAVIGVFWGAPLIARELEAGTHRLVWNQSVTRTRWIAVKLLGVGLVAMATTALFSLAVTWWASPLDAVNGDRILPKVFATRGIVPIGYAAFAFVLGVVAGMLLRRAVPAMAVTLALVAAVQIVMPLALRPHLFPPVQNTVALDTANLKGFSIHDRGHIEVEGAPQIPGAWILSNVTVTPAGKKFDGPADPAACSRDTSPQTCLNWINSLHLRQVVTYQPGSRFWALQGIETGLLLGVAVLLAAFCFWWVRRRLA
jgi:ABC-type transport system involved in multi-copper enzyme maturation permease subunit